MENTQTTSNSNSKRKLLLIVVFVALIIAGIFYFYQNQNITEFANDGSISLDEFRVSTIELSAGENPTGIPADLPMQIGNRILQNTESRTVDGRIQSVKKFTTSFTEAQALQTYTQFFEGQNWVRSESGVLESPVLMRNKQNSLLIVVATEFSETVVELSLTQQNQ